MPLSNSLHIVGPSRIIIYICRLDILHNGRIVYYNIWTKVFIWISDIWIPTTKIMLLG